MPRLPVALLIETDLLQMNWYMSFDIRVMPIQDYNFCTPNTTSVISQSHNRTPAQIPDRPLSLARISPKSLIAMTNLPDPPSQRNLHRQLNSPPTAG